ncbi:PTS sugar transporter subunit IIA [Lactovum odontotermitis]
MTDNMCNQPKLVTSDFMFCDFEAENQEEFFKKITQLLESKGIVKKEFEQALLEREREFPTGLPVGHGVAIPHTDGTYVLEDKLVFIKLKDSIEFNEMGGEDEDIISTKIIIMIVVGNGKNHLQILTELIAAIQAEGFIDGLISAADGNAMKKIVETYIKSER